MNINDTLEQRGKVHGDFTDNAELSQTLKDNLRMQPSWKKLTRVQREALEVICAKIARIMVGNPNEPDHWHDIAGYSTLAERRIVPTAPIAITEPTYPMPNQPSIPDPFDPDFPGVIYKGPTCDVLDSVFVKDVL